MCLHAQPVPPERIVGGPFVVNDGPRSATPIWIVESGHVTVHSEDGRPDKTIPVLRPEKTVLAGLRPAVTYSYQAFAGDAGKGSSKTPPSGPAKFQFVVYGDTRTRHDVHRSVIAGILKFANPDFIIHTGDLVENGADSSLWPIYFDAERELLQSRYFSVARKSRKSRAKVFGLYGR